MAVTQISRIQHRRGLEQDLPQLSSAELGWSVDTRKLYIGNGTLEEGAPTTGVTRVLTEYDIATLQSSATNSYTFVGNAAGYTAQTGPSTLSPVIRTIQAKLDDIINVRDFGALGNGITDDTAAINRALQQIYLAGTSETEPRARRTVYFPGGTYLISTPVLIPPYARLQGDGMSSSIIMQSMAAQSAASLCDSKFQTGASLGTSSAILPQDIEIAGLQFLNSTTTASAPIFVIDSASNVRVQSTKFVTGVVAGYYPNLVSIATTVATSTKVTFDSCQFIKGGNAIGITGSVCSAIRVLNSSFDDLSNVAVNLGSTMGFTSIGNYYGNVGGDILANGNNYNYSLGDSFLVNTTVSSGLRLGNLLYSGTQQYTLTTAPLVLQTLSNTAVTLSYEIRNQANARFGTFSFTRTGTSLLHDDSYVETSTGVGGNLFANSDSILASVTSGTAVFKFNFKQFL